MGAGTDETGNVIQNDNTSMEEESSDQRFSPACAGNGASNFGARPKSTVQPRVCGERGKGMANIMDSRGSAPRVRGTGI